ncbi:hypothetical protein [Lentzea sp. CA-135723]|uniref:hypothetical protein n=1 Tax=Lentzea sp. CA-135723 TaxID=3239950 RepID=UPI003D8F14FB
MELRIPDSDLARLCCSRAALEAKWGQRWTAVARRLCEIRASADVAALAHLPGAKVQPMTRSDYEITFSEGVIVRLRVDLDLDVVPAHRATVAELTAVTAHVTEDVQQ